MLLRAFAITCQYASMPVLLENARSLISELRNGRETEIHWPELRKLIEEHREEVIRTFSVRWLKSICDTYADFGDPIERRDALLICMFQKMLVLGGVDKFAAASRPAIPV